MLHRRFTDSSASPHTHGVAYGSFFVGQWLTQDTPFVSVLV